MKAKLNFAYSVFLMLAVLLSGLPFIVLGYVVAFIKEAMDSGESWFKRDCDIVTDRLDRLTD